MLTICPCLGFATGGGDGQVELDSSNDLLN